MASLNLFGSVVDRYEYDAYGSCSIYDNFYQPRSQPSDGNPHLFQGKRLDLLDGGGLKLMSWPYRNYSTYLGRWLQVEKLGMIPNDNQKINPFDLRNQYKQGMNLYPAFASNPLVNADLYGLTDCRHSCGPDVTGPVKSFAAHVASKFWDPSVTPAQRKRLCRCTMGFGMCGGDGWDIFELKHRFIYPNCGEGDCVDSVKIEGNCHDRSAVNYYLWGIMHKLCGNPGRLVIVGLAWARVWTGLYDEKLSWSVAGFVGADPTVVPAPQRLRKCRLDCCKSTWTGDFGFKWKATKLVFWPGLGIHPRTVHGLDVMGSIDEGLPER